MSKGGLGERNTCSGCSAINEAGYHASHCPLRSLLDLFTPKCLCPLEKKLNVWIADTIRKGVSTRGNFMGGKVTCWTQIRVVSNRGLLNLRWHCRREIDSFLFSNVYVFLTRTNVNCDRLAHYSNYQLSILNIIIFLFRD